MKVVWRSARFAVLIGICMYLLELFYHDHRKQAIIHDLETSPYANIIQYFPDNFSFYLITSSLWLDLLITAGSSFCFYYVATRVVKLRR